MTRTTKRSVEIVRKFYNSQEEAGAWRYPMRMFPAEYALPTSEFRLARIYFDPADTVLDVGCGAGREVVQLAEAGCSVIGVDASHAMARAAKENLVHLGDRFRVIVAEGKNLPFRDGHFRNGILAGGVIHSIGGRDNRMGCLRELRRVMNPVGTVLIHYWRVPSVPELQGLVAPLPIYRGIRLMFGAVVRLVGWATDFFRRLTGPFLPSRLEPGDAVFPRGNRLAYRHNATVAEVRRELTESNWIVSEYIRRPGAAGLGSSISNWLNGESGYFVVRRSAVSDQHSAVSTQQSAVSLRQNPNRS